MKQENENKSEKSENLTKDELKSAVGGNRRLIKIPGGVTIDKVRGKDPAGHDIKTRKTN